MIDLNRITRTHVGLTGASAGLAYATHLGDAGSILLGGAVMGLNFTLLRWMVGAVVVGDPEKMARRKTLGVMAFVLKFALFLALLAGVLWRLPIDGMSFAFGATLLVVACVVEALRHDASMLKGLKGVG